MSVRAAGVELWADGAVVAIPATAAATLRFDPTAAGGQGRRARPGALRTGGQAPPAAARSGRAERGACSPRALLVLHAARPGRPPGAVRGRVRGNAGRARAAPRLGRPGTWLASVASLRPELELDLDAPLLTTWHDDPWAQGAYSASSHSSPLDGAELARSVGSLAFAGEHTAGQWHGLMEGALRSGMRAAEDLLRR